MLWHRDSFSWAKAHSPGHRCHLSKNIPLYLCYPLDPMEPSWWPLMLLPSLKWVVLFFCTLLWVRQGALMKLVASSARTPSRSWPASIGYPSFGQLTTLFNTNQDAPRAFLHRFTCAVQASCCHWWNFSQIWKPNKTSLKLVCESGVCFPAIALTNEKCGLAPDSLVVSPALTWHYRPWITLSWQPANTCAMHYASR